MTKGKFSIGRGVECDLDRLVNTRLLIQANSGAGKSWALRRLLEQTHGRIQQLVIDPEGEFASLRERYDYVLAARQGGDTLADARTAKLLAERLLELGVSAILDIYELNPHERTRFVKLFLEALVDAPKNLWHPVLVVVDEAHVYCAEKDESESAAAVKSLCSRGRKRGFCAVLATQRLSKLAKDAAAECNNKLIGRTSLDVDMARAGDELGFTKADRMTLRDLDAGEFFAFGPALTRDVTKVKVGDVHTHHPKAGSKLAAVVPAPSDRVKALLPKLSDLPAEAEAREKTVADLKRDLATTRRELTEARKAQPPAPKVDAAKAEKVADLKQQLARQQRALDAAMKILVKIKAVDFPVETDEDRKALGQAIAAAVQQVTGPIEKRVTALAARVEGIRLEAGRAQTAIAALLDEKIDLTVQVQKREPFAVAAERPARATNDMSRRPARANSDGGGPLKAMHRAMLTALAQHPAGLTKKQILVHTGYASSGPVSTAFADLARESLAMSNGNLLAITDAGLSVLGAYEPLPLGDALREWLLTGDKLSTMERALLSAICAAYPHAIRKGDVLEKAGYASSGPVSSAFAKLVAYNYAVPQGASMLKAAEELFDV